MTFTLKTWKLLKVEKVGLYIRILPSSGHRQAAAADVCIMPYMFGHE